VTTLQDELIEFYRQLSLLAKANLPLPQSLQSLARDCRSRRLAPVIASLADDVGNGVPLSDALARRGDVFSPLHVHIIAAGERGGVLMEALREAAEIGRFERRQAQQLRETASYPVVTFVIATGVLLAVLRFVVPGMAQAFAEMMGMVRLSGLSLLVFRVSEVVCRAGLVPFALYLAGTAGLVWLAFGGSTSDRILGGVLRALPGSASVVHLLDNARAAGLFSVLFARQTPADQALMIVADTTRSRKLATAFARSADACASGRSLPASVAGEHALPDSLRLVLSTSAEADMPSQLQALQELYVEQAEITMRRLAVFWELAVVCATTTFVGLIILSLFLPLIRLIDALGG